VANKLDLEEKGTRYDHYMELREVFQEAVEVLRNLDKGYKTPEDGKRQERLQHAADAVQARIEYLSDFAKKTEYGSRLQTEIKSIPRTEWKREIALPPAPEPPKKDDGLAYT